MGWLGKAISAGQRSVRTLGDGRAAGGLLVLVVLVFSAAAALAFEQAVLLLPAAARVAVLSCAAGILLAGRTLSRAGRRVAEHLRLSDLAAAREAVGRMVGRDTEDLDSDGVVRAAVESVAENTTDGMIAPLFFLAAGGLVGLVLYKAVNTMDSMLGYTDRRHRRFGWAAARLDDVCNWLPARLSALLWPVAAGICGLDCRGAFRIMLRDGGKHSSPNAGIAEAAAAGAVGVQLGGLSRQRGRVRRRQRLGEPRRRLNWRRIEETVRLSEVVCKLFLLMTAVTTYFLR